MNKSVAKKIRKIINPRDEITRRVYRRAKKQYCKVPKGLREEFLISLDEMINGESKLD
tara:strand:+ start:10774 stop:10947 length:174 start_codon:yes stop_codon:yes gene_type:complete